MKSHEENKKYNLYCQQQNTNMSIYTFFGTHSWFIQSELELSSFSFCFWNTFHLLNI